ncbi:hypothetical protein V1290_006797 [Bradyrhizobium sp. AZCC 1578]
MAYLVRTSAIGTDRRLEDRQSVSALNVALMDATSQRRASGRSVVPATVPRMAFVVRI